jgi:hypothetical protein
VAHNHDITDSDVSFVIDPTNRAITTESSKLCLVQHDHNSEKYTFEIARFVEGHDISECDTVLIDFDNTNRRKTVVNSGAYLVTDITTEDDRVLFTWLVSREATQLVGYLTFSVSFRCHDDENNIIYEWGTDTFQRITIIEKSRHSQAILENNPDLIDQIKVDILKSVEETIPTKVSDLEQDVLHPQSDWNQDDEDAADFIKNKPQVPSDEHINSLIDEKLGVIENGTY